MIFRLQLDMEIDTATRQTRVVNPPLLVEGGEHVCLNTHCGKVIPLRLKYCTRACYRSSGNKRPRKGTVVLERGTTVQPDRHLLDDDAVVVNVTPTVIATPELIPAPSPVVASGVVRDYSHFSMSLTTNGGA